ncbi:MAG: hypothetical protein HQL23_02435 [Candidatus Omnitrophica bacterium]|nr:hypothetical protein [Candidatus Omnitrophota bacterium]
MAKIFALKILSTAGAIYSSDIASLIVPAADGYMGVLAEHAPFLAHLKTGRFTLRHSDGKNTVWDSPVSGFMEVLKTRVTIVLDGDVTAQDLRWQTL